MNRGFDNSGKIYLRAPEPVDVDVLYDMENDTAVWRVSNTFAPFSRFQIEQYVLGSPNDIFANRQLRLLIDIMEDDRTRQTAGAIDLFDIDPFHRRAGIGILVREPFRGKGIAAEAISMVVHYAFSTLGLHQLYCNISSDNTPSIRLFERQGFVRCGMKQEWLRDGAGWKDELMFQLINHED